MKTLVIDQSTANFGWCLVDEDRIIKYGCKTLNKKAQTVDRMVEGIQWLHEQKGTYDELVFENVQLQAGNAQTFQILSQLQGMVLMYCKMHNIPYYIYGSTTWKSTCGIKGRKRDEQKANAHRFAEARYGISTLCSQDAVDAICIAHHHIITKKT